MRQSSEKSKASDRSDSHNLSQLKSDLDFKIKLKPNFSLNPIFKSDINFYLLKILKWHCQLQPSVLQSIGTTLKTSNNILFQKKEKKRRTHTCLVMSSCKLLAFWSSSTYKKEISLSMLSQKLGTTWMLA